MKKWKCKVIKSILSLSLMVGLLSAMSLSIKAKTTLTPTPDAAFKYANDSKYGGVYIYNFDSTLAGSTDIVIPNTLGGKTVTRITATTFKNCGLTSLVLPNGLIEIGSTSTQGIFSSNNLTEITLPDTLTYICNNAFSDNQITSVTLSPQLKTLGASAFASNPITSLTLTGSIKEIPSSAFKATNLKEVIIPEGIEIIGTSAFENSKLETVKIADSVTSIGTQAFNNCHIKNLTLGNSLQIIGTSAFRYNVDLTEVILPETLTTIGASAFEVNAIKELRIPNAVTSIGANAFNANKIEKLIIGSGLTEISESCFSQNELSTITFPSNIIKIGAKAFMGNQMATLELPNTVTTIETQAFDNQQIYVPLLKKTGAWSYDVSTVSNDIDFSKTINLEAKSTYGTYDSTTTMVNITTLPKINYDIASYSYSLDNTNTYTQTLNVRLIVGAYTYNVLFKNDNNSILKEQVVAHGENATAPETDPTSSIPNMKFIGWDKEFTNISDETIITAQYKLASFKINIAEEKEIVSMVYKDGVNTINSTNSLDLTLTMTNLDSKIDVDFKKLDWVVENIAGFEGYEPVVKVDDKTGKVIGLKSGVAKVTVKLKDDYDPDDPSTYDSCIVIVPGDVMKEGKLSSKDAIFISNYIADKLDIDKLPGNKDYSKELMDMDGNGLIQTKDLIIIKRMLATLIEPSN